jgi:hypothetical protein
MWTEQSFLLFNFYFWRASDRFSQQSSLPRGATGSFADANPIKSHAYDSPFCKSPNHLNLLKVFQFALVEPPLYPSGGRLVRGESPQLIFGDEFRQQIFPYGLQVQKRKK